MGADIYHIARDESSKRSLYGLAVKAADRRFGHPCTFCPTTSTAGKRSDNVTSWWPHRSTSHTSL